MDLWKSLSGMVEAELTSADLGAAFTAISQADIAVFSVRQTDDLTARLRIPRSDFARLSALAEKRGERLRLISRPGLYWLGKRLLGRPVLAMGLFVLLLVSTYLPTRVLFVRVEGNTAVPTRLILAAAEDCGIRFGASRRAVRSEKVKNALLESVPELQWAGVNTAGCVATISVRERIPEEDLTSTGGVSGIAAVRDGVILSVTATAGTALCQPGQAVREGQLLISGYTDCGITIRAGQAEGEVFAQTNRNFTAVTPANTAVIVKKHRAGQKISLVIGKKRINLWKDSGISEGSCGRMYTEYYITLPGGFRLPPVLWVETFYTYDTVQETLSQEAAATALDAFALGHLSQQMIAGTVLQKSQTLSFSEGLYRMEGSYLCAEMIGRRKQEQIGELHGKDS